MSIERTVMLGAYLVAEVEQVEKIRAYRVCPDGCQIGYSRVGSYCSACGSVITTMNETVMEWPDGYDILPYDEEWADVLYCPEYDMKDERMIFLPNIGAEGATIDVPRAGDVVVTAGDILACRLAFTKAYADAITRIRKKVKSVSVEFGIVSYWS